MRRIDVLTIALVVFFAGGGLYLLFQTVGLDSIQAGIWTQLLLVLALIGWVTTYVLRAATQKMTYNQQLQDYAEAVLQKRLEELTPEELAKLQADLDKDPPA
ncbi:MAG: DUF3007 family protein [Synechococcales bacterium]|nr:DUF3007 family protein [Synechococcales bacterium]